MTTLTTNIESESTNDVMNDENLSFDTNQISSDEQLSQIIDSINLSTACEDTNTDESQTKSSSTTTTRTSGQTAIGAKLVKKLETLAATSKETKPNNGKTSTTTAAAATNAASSTTTNNESESRRNITKAAKNIVKSLTDSDPQKNLLTLATKIAEFQEQQRLTQAKANESEKRLTILMRERDQALLENGRIVAAKAKLESLCRELHRHSQQIRDESAQRQRDEETKRRELATKFQTTIDEIASQLSNYSEKSTSLREQNMQLSEELTSVVKKYELREKEVEAALKKRELELRLTEASLEQSHTLLEERTELIKQERQVSEAERLVLYKKCEELAASELSLRSQVQMYSERYQEFQNAIQQSSQMVTSCHGEIEKMGKKIKKLEKERSDFRHRWEVAEQNQRKANEDFKLLEKEKRQLEIKLDKLDKLSRALQQERSDLQGTIKKLSKSATTASTSSVPTPPPPTTTVTSSTTSVEDDPSVNVNASSTSEIPTSSEIAINGHDVSKADSVLSTTSDVDASSIVSESPNLYDSELGRIANTVD
ncbi:unnamed protein product [Rotaria sordida]|uniref:Alpha-taxilin n=1 Tax=Rotaria sordida TaxID=392033 RepID=A0A818JLF3_9BILA|nr:unnamed protein product [Rotaria sordida]